MDEKLVQELKALEDKLTGQLDAKTKKEVEAQIKAIKDEYAQSITDLKAQIKIVKDEGDKAIEKAAEDFTQYKAEMGRLNVSNTKEPSFKDELGEQLEKNKSKLEGYNTSREGVKFNIKAVGNMAAANTTISGTTTFAGSSQLGALGRKPYETMHIRDFVRVQSINSDSAHVNLCIS